jgi:hypothetical protein
MAVDAGSMRNVGKLSASQQIHEDMHQVHLNYSSKPLKTHISAKENV